jgi:hypothetical protein
MPVTFLLIWQMYAYSPQAYWKMEGGVVQP